MGSMGVANLCFNYRSHEHIVNFASNHFYEYVLPHGRKSYLSHLNAHVPFQI